MEEKKEEKILELVHQQPTYKMLIPQKVEKKIRLLCREINNVEWSGVLFYKVSGSFEDKSLLITCVDIFQMDEGTGGYTEYDMSSDVCTYICDHPELMEVVGIYQGLIHSHASMPTFFSGTDTNTLRTEGNDMNHFVSLIVNNAGKYTAGITRKVKVKQAINEEFSYPTWGNNSNSGNKVFVVEKEYIQWFNLDIEIEKVSSDFEEEMLARIKEIRAAKSSRSYNILHSHKTEETSVREAKAGSANMEVEQPTLFDNNFKLNEDIVDWVVKQTVTCSVIIPNNSNIDVEKWVKSMDSLYSNRFANKKEFEIYANNFIDFLVNYTEDPEAAAYLDATEMSATLAYQVKEKLSKLPKNEWLDILIEIYDDYIM